MNPSPFRCLILKHILLFFFLAGSLQAQLLHDYGLNGDYLDAFGGNPIVPNGGYLTAIEYVFDIDQGPNVSGVIDPESYTIEMRFTPTLTQWWAKILDFNNRLSDNGLYISNGQLEFWPYTPYNHDVVFQPGIPATLMFSRNEATSLITACVNGVHQWTMADIVGNAVFAGPDNIIHILMDDLIEYEGPMAGSLDYFKIYNYNLEVLELELGDQVTTCEPYVIDPGVTGVDFLWSTGSTDPVLLVTETGTYSLTITMGCAGVAVDSVQVIFNEGQATVELGPSEITVCEGDSYIISLDPNIGDYLWQDGSTDPEYTITTAGLYQVTFEDGCDITTDAILVEVMDLVSVNISGVPPVVCEYDDPILLPTVQQNVTGTWSGEGVTNNFFDPWGLAGNIILTFTPDAGQCALPVWQNVLVSALALPALSGVPSSICETDIPIPLPTAQDGYSGSWSGPGVTTNTFNPIGLSGSITLTFTPDAGQCAVSNTLEINVNPLVVPSISGITDSICESNNPISLSPLQNGIVGNWSGSGVSNNTFNPEGQNGIVLLTFTPNTSQCALEVQWNITIGPSLVPVLSGVPSVLCQTDLPIDLPAVQNGYTGLWSGPGITNNTFNPNGWSGPITLFFNPNTGQCAEVANAIIVIDSAVIPLLSGIPNTLCESDTAISLSTLQDAINGHWSGPGVLLNEFNPIGQNGYVMLAFTPDSGQCAVADTAVIFISTLIVPDITDVPPSLCQSDSVLLLPGLQSGITGTWSGHNVNANTFSTTGLNGNYALIFSPASGQCADTTTAVITVLTSPSFVNLIASCDSLAEFYTVTFEITGGDPASYDVNGMPVNGNIFTSFPLLSDSAHYAFTLDDANGCGPVEIQGSTNCACATYAGTMNFSGGPLKVCSGADFSVSFNGDAQLDLDDLVQFVLHDNAGTQLGTYYAVSSDTTFTFPSGIILGQTYYVSVIAGSNNGIGSIDLNDRCLSVAQGIPVIFYQPQVTVSSGGDICPSACMTYTFNLEGEEPFELSYQVIANGMVTDHVLVTDTSTVSILICPQDYGMTSGTIDIVPLTLVDANCTVPLSPVMGSLTLVQSATSSMISRCALPGTISISE